MLTVWVLTKSRIVDSLLYCCLHYLFKEGSPTEFFWPDLLVSILWDLPVCPQLGVGARDSNSDCKACSGNTFPTKLLPSLGALKFDPVKSFR